MELIEKMELMILGTRKNLKIQMMRIIGEMIIQTLKKKKMMKVLELKILDEQLKISI